MSRVLGDESLPENYKRLFVQVEELLKSFDLDSSCIEKIIKHLEDSKMVQYQEYPEFESPKQFSNFLSCFKSLPLYEEYTTYQGYNLQNIK